MLEIFAPLKDGYFIDCTLGFGGHSEAILKLHPEISVIGIDQDPNALSFSKQRLEHFGTRFRAESGRFSDVLPKILHDIDASKIVGVLADIGVSSLQLDDLGRGFSFNSENLDMRMNPESQLSALEVVNSYPKDRLAHIFREFGEVREWQKLANIIAEERKKSRITSAQHLAQLIEKNFKRIGNIHPATLAFQAIRIEVNDELGEISRLLETASILPNAYVAVISFHSLEDRIVKNFFKKWSDSCICEPHVLRCECGNNHAKGVILTKKPIVASSEETRLNPRARSAKLRAFRLMEMK